MTSLDDVGKGIADAAEGMGPIVAMRSTLTQGGWSPEDAEALVLETVKSMLAQNLARIVNGQEAT